MSSHTAVQRSRQDQAGREGEYRFGGFQEAGYSNTASRQKRAKSPSSDVRRMMKLKTIFNDTAWNVSAVHSMDMDATSPAGAGD